MKRSWKDARQKKRLPLLDFLQDFLEECQEEQDKEKSKGKEEAGKNRWTRM